MHTTNIKDITLSEEPAYNSKFPNWLKEIAEVWYSVYHRDKHIGEIYLKQEKWRAFTICVDVADGTLDGCVKFLIENR